MKVIRLESTDSTSTYLRTVLHDAPHGTVVVTDRQLAGRGQRGNSWEAAPGQNLTFSVMVHPVGIEAMTQYAISEAVSTAIVTTLKPLVPEPELLAIKWPNDIYYGDRKLCGILIENSLSGMTVSKTIIGVGINVNQQEFVSDAPNPVSLWQITRHEYDLGSLLNDVCMAIIEAVECLSDAQLRSEIAREYRGRLWRREGLHPFRSPDGRLFMAEIVEVLPTGHLVLRHDDGQLSTHAFKEVIQIL